MPSVSSIAQASLGLRQLWLVPARQLSSRLIQAEQAATRRAQMHLQIRRVVESDSPFGCACAAEHQAAGGAGQALLGKGLGVAHEELGARADLDHWCREFVALRAKHGVSFHLRVAIGCRSLIIASGSCAPQCAADAACAQRRKLTVISSLHARTSHILCDLANTVRAASCRQKLLNYALCKPHYQGFMIWINPCLWVVTIR